MEQRLSLKMTYRRSFTRRPTLGLRYHLFGLALPTFLTVYFLVCGELILSRPEGFAVLWWMQVVKGSIPGAEKTIHAFAKVGFAPARLDYASHAFALFVFAVMFNSVIQVFLGFRIKLNIGNVKLNHDGLRKDLRLDPKIYYFLLFVLFAGFAFSFLYLGFTPSSSRRSIDLHGFRGLGSTLLLAMICQYFSGAIAMYVIALVRHKAI
jgi:hypothetical protein